MKIIDAIDANNKTCNSLYPNSMNEIESPITENIQIKYPNLEKRSLISQTLLL
jgi:hypothetical protein